MSNAAPFETHHERYDAWFARHEPAYISELLALLHFEQPALARKSKLASFQP
ncbi:hypothetical protein D3C80_2194850 [compost metagenome]